MVICAISAWTIGSPGQIMVRALESASRRGHEVHVFAQKKDGYDASWIPNYHRVGSELGLRIHVRLTNDTGLHGCFSFFSTLRAPSLNFNQKFAGLLSQNNLKNIRFKSNCIWEIKLL